MYFVYFVNKARLSRSIDVWGLGTISSIIARYACSKLILSFIHWQLLPNGKQASSVRKTDFVANCSVADSV